MVVLQVGGETIPAHKCILSVFSPVFAAAFANKTPFLEGRDGVLRIEDFPAPPVRAMLEFLYTGAISWTLYGEEGMEEAVLLLADKYGIVALEEHMEGRLADRINTENFMEVAVFADVNSCQLLKKVINSHAHSPSTRTHLGLCPVPLPSLHHRHPHYPMGTFR